MFFFNDTTTRDIYTLSLHPAIPISEAVEGAIPPLAVAAAAVDVRAVRVALPDLDQRVPHRLPLGVEDPPGQVRHLADEIGRAHVRTPVTPISRMPSSA